MYSRGGGLEGVALFSVWRKKKDRIFCRVFSHILTRRPVYGGERKMGAATGTHLSTMALCRTPRSKVKSVCR